MKHLPTALNVFLAFIYKIIDVNFNVLQAILFNLNKRFVHYVIKTVKLAMVQLLITVLLVIKIINLIIVGVYINVSQESIKINMDIVTNVILFVINVGDQPIFNVCHVNFQLIIIKDIVFSHVLNLLIIILIHLEEHNVSHVLKDAYTVIIILYVLNANLH